MVHFQFAKDIFIYVKTLALAVGLIALSSCTFAAKIISTASNQIGPAVAPNAILAKAHLSNLFPKYKLTLSDCTDAVHILVNLGGRPSAADSSWGACSTTAGAITYDSLLSLAESQNLHVWSKDAAGNVSRSASIVNVPTGHQLTLGQVSSSVVETAAQGFALPYDMAASADGTRFAVTDVRNSRVLLYDGDPTLPGARPTVVLGQDSAKTVGFPYADASQVNATMLASPVGVAIVGEKVLVVDNTLNRVLIWNSWPTQNKQAADIVLGQSAMSGTTANVGDRSCATVSTPNGVSFDGTRLYVADAGNNRILIWNSLPTESGTAADVVLGQPDCATSIAGVNDHTLKGPSHAHSDGTTLVITDLGNHRILIYDISGGFPSTGASADFVVGQTSMTSGAPYAGSTLALAGSYGVNAPYRAYIWNEKLYISDYGAQRVLIHNAIPSANGAAADVVLGQGNFTTSNLSTAESRTGSVIGMARTTNDIYVVGYSLNLIKKFEDSATSPASNNKPATAYRGANYLDYLGLNLSESPTTSAAELQAPSASRIFFNIGTGKYMLAVADSFNHRVLLWNELPTATHQAPDVVLGQPDFVSKLANNPALASAASMKKPTDVASDGVKLFVADQENNRVLIWNSIPTVHGAAADSVLGQANLTDTSLNRGGTVAANTLNLPSNLLINSNRLFVSDNANNRVLLWTSLPTAMGQAADLVIGQATFATKLSTTNTTTLGGPRGLAIAEGKLFVVASKQFRVLVWNSVPEMNGVAADFVLGQANMTSATSTPLYIPVGITADSTGVWVLDYFRMHFFDMASLAIGVASRIEMGQNSPTNSRTNFSGISAFSFSVASGIEKHDGYYWITDTSNHRVLKLQLPF